MVVVIDGDDDGSDIDCWRTKVSKAVLCFWLPVLQSVETFLDLCDKVQSLLHNISQKKLHHRYSSKKNHPKTKAGVHHSLSPPVKQCRLTREMLIRAVPYKLILDRRSYKTLREQDRPMNNKELPNADEETRRWGLLGNDELWWGGKVSIWITNLKIMLPATAFIIISSPNYPTTGQNPLLFFHRSRFYANHTSKSYNY